MFLLKKNLKSCGFYLIRENLAFLLKETKKKPSGRLVDVRDLILYRSY